jgi:hypothetical protein
MRFVVGHVAQAKVIILDDAQHVISGAISVFGFHRFNCSFL